MKHTSQQNQHIFGSDLYLIVSTKNNETVFVGYDEGSGGYPYVTKNLEINYKSIIFNNYQEIHDWFKTFTSNDYFRLGINPENTYITKLEIILKDIEKISN